MKGLENAAIAEQLEAFAGLLDLGGSSYYTSRAYRRAAETIRETRAPIAELVAAGRVQELRGIGPGIAGRLRELVETGTIAELDELERDVRPELVGWGGSSASARSGLSRSAARSGLRRWRSSGRQRRPGGCGRCPESDRRPSAACSSASSTNDGHASARG